MPPAPHRPLVSNLFINLCDIADGALPSLQPATLSDETLLMWTFQGCTLWLRPAQVNEIIAKLAVHLPEAPVRTMLREIFYKRTGEVLESDLPVPFGDADLPTPKLERNLP